MDLTGEDGITESFKIEKKIYKITELKNLYLFLYPYISL